MLFVDGKPSYVLLREEDTIFSKPDLPDLKSIDFYFESGMEITRKEIEDKSKADPFSKGLVVIQTGWFTLQCISRLVQHLPLTELELMTVGFAVLSLVTYILWWHKPLNVQCAFPVHNMESTPEGQPIIRGGGESESESRGVKGGTSEEGSHRGALISGTVAFIWKQLERLIDSLFGRDRYEFWHAKRVPTFFAGSLETRVYVKVGLIATIVAATFGAIHCVAWSFQFPSATERFLWRTASLAITCLPWPLCLITTVVRLHGQSLPAWSTVLLRVFGYTGVFLYILGRVVLLVLVFLSLRSLPPGAYKTVNWATFIPHI